LMAVFIAERILLFRWLAFRSVITLFAADLCSGIFLLRLGDGLPQRTRSAQNSQGKGKGKGKGKGRERIKRVFLYLHLYLYLPFRCSLRSFYEQKGSPPLL